MPAMSKTRTVYLQTFTTDVHLWVLLFVRLWLFLYYVPFTAHCEIELGVSKTIQNGAVALQQTS